MVQIDVHLNPNADGKPFYIPGQTLSGVVTLHLNHAKNIRGLFLLLHGAANVHWTKYEYRRSTWSRKADWHRVKYSGVQTYLDQRSYLFGAPNANAVEMASGTYKYNFSVEIPHGVPGSLAGSKGNILYMYEVRLDIPWAFDKEIKGNFIVVRHDDLRQFPDLRPPRRQQKIQKFCSIFCSGGSCEVTVTLPHGGFAVGKSIQMQIHYANSSEKYKIKQTNIALKRNFIYTAHNPRVKSKFEEVTVLKTSVKGVESAQTRTVNCEMEIPSIMLPSSEHYCNVLCVRYALEFTCISSGCDENISFTFPIVLGAVAFDEEDNFNLSMNAPNPYPMTDAYQPSIYECSSPTLPLMAPSAPFIPNDLPPSFEDATHANPSMLKQNDPINSESVGWNVPLSENFKM